MHLFVQQRDSDFWQDFLISFKSSSSSGLSSGALINCNFVWDSTTLAESRERQNSNLVEIQSHLRLRRPKRTKTAAAGQKRTKIFKYSQRQCTSHPFCHCLRYFGRKGISRLQLIVWCQLWVQLVQIGPNTFCNLEIYTLPILIRIHFAIWSNAYFKISVAVDGSAAAEACWNFDKIGSFELRRCIKGSNM